MKEFDDEKPRTVGFIDLGHSACNIFFSQFTKKAVKVISVSGERFCGAREFDYLIAQKLAEDAEDVADAKYSVCQFIKDGKEIFVKVFFFKEDSNEEFVNLEPVDDEVEKTIAGIDGVYNANKYGDNTPTFRFLKDGKLVEVNAPDDDTLNSILKN